MGLLPLRALCPSCGKAEMTEHGMCTDCWSPNYRTKKVRRSDRDFRKRMGLDDE